MADPLSFRLKKHFDRYIHDPIAALIAIPLFLLLDIDETEINSKLKKNPQFVCIDKNKQYFFVIVRICL